SVKEVFGKKHLLPVHQGRAAENVLAQTFVRPGMIVPMNYHFTTTKAHIDLNGGTVVELLHDDALIIKSDNPFKGNFDLNKLLATIEKYGADKIAFIRLEASTNLIGGQPFSLKNMRDVQAIAKKYGIMTVLDASLIGENAYWIKRREPEYLNVPVAQILLEMCDTCDLVYFSSRKVSSSRGGGICTNDIEIFNKMKELIPLYEGFFTYGGISVREIEAMAIGLRETTDLTVISQSPEFIRYTVEQLDNAGIPVVMPAGGLGCHVDAKSILSHVPQKEYPAGALAAAFYIISGIRGMERGTISSVRDENGNDVLADVELLRLAFPRRVFTLSQVKFLIDRMKWLYHNRELIGGLEFYEEPSVLRFFAGKLKPTSNWAEKLVEKFKSDFGNSL
ncbi:MAG: tryptophanase, partial [Bacteroidota bacterium]|nr:tryptophanase [Bacteroidota bacterium]